MSLTKPDNDESIRSESEEREDEIFREIMLKVEAYRVQQTEREIAEYQASGKNIVPDGADERMLRAIREEAKRLEREKQQELPPKQRKLLRLSGVRRKVIAVAAAVALVGAVGASADKLDFFNVNQTERNSTTEIKYSLNTLLSPYDYHPSELGYVPDGMEEESESTEDMSNYIIYRGDDGSYIDFEKYFIAGQSFSYNSEGAVKETVAVNGDDDAIFSSRTTEDGETENTLIWTDWNSQYSIISNLDKDEMIKIANNVTTSEE